MPCPFAHGQGSQTGFDIMIEDADGREVWLETSPDLPSAEARITEMQSLFPGTKLVAREHSITHLPAHFQAMAKDH